MRAVGWLPVLLVVVAGCPATSNTTGPATLRRPTPPAAAAAAASPALPGRTVVVAPGDTLAAIAAAHGVGVDELIEVNGLVSSAVHVGDRLFVPASSATGTSSAPAGVGAPVSPAATPSASPSRSSSATSSKTPLLSTAPTTSLAASSTAASADPTTATAPLRWPVDGVVLRDFSAPVPATARRPARDGYDGVLIAAPSGAPVHAAASGTVVFAGSQGTTTGIFVVIEHPDGLVTIYAHLRRATVTAGQTVARGDVVGEIGTTGLTGASPRVQFQVRRAQVPVDPAPLLPP